jgi:Protein of unknown function (DUF4231)
VLAATTVSGVDVQTEALKGEKYSSFLKRTMGEVIDSLELSPDRKVYLKNRWLDQLAWMDRKASQAKRWHYASRWFALAGGLVIPVLAGLSLEGSLGEAAQYAIVVLGLMVALALGHEDLFKNGERWQHYRQAVELLKIQGWRFFQLASPYDKFADHRAAYPSFADRIEDILRQDVHVYIAEIGSEREEKDARTQPAKV